MMVGQESEFWEELRGQWKIVKGEEKGDIARAQQRINTLQDKLGVEVTDFNEEKRKNREFEPFTLSKAEEILGEENIRILEQGLDRALAIRTIVADLTPRKDPSLKNNPAGIGQMVNVTYDQSKDKLKWGKKDES